MNLIYNLHSTFDCHANKNLSNLTLDREVRALRERFHEKSGIIGMSRGIRCLRTFESLSGCFRVQIPHQRVAGTDQKTTVKALNQQLSFDFCQPVYPFEASLTYIGRF